MILSETSITAIAVALIGSLGVIVAAGAPLLISTHRKAKQAATDSAVTREQVTNDHDTNMRVEGDERHEAVMRALQNQGRNITRNTKQINKIMTRLDVVEDTLPTNPNRKRKS